MIKYLGSKRLLLPAIVGVIESLPGVRRVADLFSGTARVGHALKGAGFAVHANDQLSYAEHLARCYVQADAEVWGERAERLLGELRHAAPRAGWFTEDYCVEARYFQPENGARIEGVREAIARLELEPELESIALVSLMEAADRVDSTTGVQMAYLKQWAQRAGNPLDLRLPAVLPRAAAGPCTSSRRDALELAAEVDADVAYLDPPYNQHSYLGNYHVWETLVRWDRPPVYGIARKRVDCRERKSPFNRRREAAPALEQVIDRLATPYVVASFSNEGHVSRDELEALLGRERRVHVLARDYARYVGARIGIHDRQGRRVGRPGHLRNTEFLFVATPFDVDWQPAGLEGFEPSGGPVDPVREA
ncbi:DNA adenine methylase [Engelhardtia mirabilis]|uniref:site-specific DNA-methyltransferase (adenine-specific) n=1 Tax=Engelhardtia mirabilis TaxID=2528011 RepID=A0A518BG54_9BACT|nr:Modification methylase FokI [Planctomycetes bacterium Pla133]QDV00285.1 Modification methylase FokI [Planctomycetes bacterium Pla86]